MKYRKVPIVATLATFGISNLWGSLLSGCRNCGNSERAQTTDRIKTILTQGCQTTLGLAPPDATSKNQPLDLAFNAEFKKNVEERLLESACAVCSQFEKPSRYSFVQLSESSH